LQCGSTSYARIVPEHEGLDLAKIEKFICETDFCGLFDVEFKYANGTVYFIECNFRNGAPGYSFTCLKKCIPLMWISDLYDEKYLFNQQTYLTYFMCEQTDFLHVLKRSISFKKWYQNYRKSLKIFYSKETFL